MLHHLMLLFALTLLPICAGCNPAPKSSAALQAADSQAFQEASRSYWRDRAPDVGDAGTRVVLAEFAVEFITSKHRSPSDRQAAFVPPHPVILAAGAAGVGAKRVDFKDDAFARIAADLESIFRDESQRAGLTLVEASADLPRLPAGQPRESASLNIGASDTGRIRGARVEPGPMGGLIDLANRRAAQQRLREALDAAGADAAIRVQLRVGVFDGYASCEQGSRIEIVTRNAAGDLVTSASLLSTGEVVSAQTTDSRYDVVTEAYRRELRTIAPLYIRMGLMQAAE